MITAIVKARVIEEKMGDIRRVAAILQYEYAPDEPGCLQYESYIDGEQFVTIERWLDQAHLNQHLAAEYVKEYVPQLRACVVGGIFDVLFIDSEGCRHVTI
ncbi:putative quinol monooxygenase [Photobacterium ganghwense]|uniref:putative quinol monooxygenase n=1 Tax=Photobacterium ganghwense TaxID=320778 RepID=UPI0039F07D5B